jgi:hypothetical protein
MPDIRKPIKIDPKVYERIKAKAEREGKTISEVIAYLLSQVPDFDVASIDEEKECVFCGQPSGKHFICEECYYDPDVIRPAIMGALFTEFRMRVLETTGNNITLDDFAALMDYETAKAHYVTDGEWREWQEWLEWRKRHKEDPLARATIEWREWVRAHPISKLRHLGALMFVKDREGRSGLQSVGEIIRSTFPIAYAAKEQGSGENANDADREGVGDAERHDSSNVGHSAVRGTETQD